MTKIKYSLFETETEAIIEVGTQDSRLAIELTDVKEGAIILEGVSMPIACGNVTVELAKLSDGVHHPIFTVNSLTFRLPAFIKDSDGIRLPPLADSEIRKLSLRARQSEARLGELEHTVRRLENYIKNTTIF